LRVKNSKMGLLELGLISSPNVWDDTNVGKRHDEEVVDCEVENPEGGEQTPTMLMMMAP
jgi:hypothetical protein